MNTKLNAIVSHPKFVPVTVGILSFGAGLGVGFFLGRRTKFDYETILEELMNRDEPLELEFDKDFPGEEAVAEATQIVEIIPEPESEEEPGVTAVINDIEWDWEEELSARTDLLPYVLHRDEFFNEEKGYYQSTLTYYNGDDILVDDQDAPVYNYKFVIGELKFGHGSGDPHVFYVRNDKRHGEYEVLWDDGMYSVEVLGLDPEPAERAKHIRHASVPKFRTE